MSITDSPRPSSAAAARRMRATRQRDTTAELEIRRLLHRKGLRYRIDERVIPDLRSRADIVFRRARVAVFIDGCFWHCCPRHRTFPRSNASWWRDKLNQNQERDRRTASRLRKEGWKVLRIWEHIDPRQAAQRIGAIVRLRS